RVRRLEDSPGDFGERQPIGGGVELFEAPGGLNRLKRHSPDGRLRQREIDQLADFPLVPPLLQRDDERRRNPKPVEPFERSRADVPQVGTSERNERISFERIELQINLEIRHVFCQPLREHLILGDPDAVGVHHEMADRCRLCPIENGEEVGMKRRLTAGDLPHGGLSLFAPDRVDQALDVIEGAVLLPLRSAARVTDWTTEVAVVGHFDDREAGVLLMVGAEATIVRTSPANGRVERARHLRRLDEPLAALAVVAHVIRDEDALVSMGWAVLQEVHGVVLKDDLAFDLSITRGADGDGDVIEKIWTNAISHAPPPRSAAAGGACNTQAPPDSPNE